MNGVDPAYQSLPGGELTKKLEKVMDKKIAEALDGVSAKSAYQSYVDTTTDSPVKTEAEWVASLKGEDGVSLGEVAIADNLTTDDGTKVLSARQGYNLGQKVNDVDDVPTAGSEKFVKSGGVAFEHALQNIVVAKCAIMSTTWLAGSDRTHIVIPVNGGERIEWFGKSVLYYAVLTNYSTFPQDGDTPAFLDGYTGRQTSSSPFNIPSGCKYLIINAPSIYTDR